MKNEKYIIHDGYASRGAFIPPALMNKKSRAVIPDDEPVFILRAKDRHAIPTLLAYTKLLRMNQGTEVAEEFEGTVVEQFRDFKDAHPELMKQPD